MPREDAATKGRRMLAEGRLTVERLTPSGLIVARCRGDSGAVYALGFDPDGSEWRCTCPSRGRCSHLRALQLVVVA